MSRDIDVGLSGNRWMDKGRLFGADLTGFEGLSTFGAYIKRRKTRRN